MAGAMAHRVVCVWCSGLNRMPVKPKPGGAMKKPRGENATSKKKETNANNFQLGGDWGEIGE